MDTGLTRTVASPQPVAPARPPELSAATKTELPIEATVTQATASGEARGRDAQAESQAARAGIRLPSLRRREIENDAATGMIVMKYIEENSGQVVDQVPADAYLRMKNALNVLLESDMNQSHAAQYSA